MHEHVIGGSEGEGSYKQECEQGCCCLHLQLHAMLEGARREPQKFTCSCLQSLHAVLEGTGAIKRTRPVAACLQVSKGTHYTALSATQFILKEPILKTRQRRRNDDEQQQQ